MTQGISVSQLLTSRPLVWLVLTHLQVLPRVLSVLRVTTVLRHAQRRYSVVRGHIAVPAQKPVQIVHPGIIVSLDQRSRLSAQQALTVQR